MTRQRKVIYAALAFTFTVCIVGAGLSFRNDTEAERAYGRIKLGMRRAEVAELLGKPIKSDDEAYRAFYRAKYDVKVSAPDNVTVNESPEKIDVWEWPDETIVVGYSSNYKVCRYYLCNRRMPLRARLRQIIAW